MQVRISATAIKSAQQLLCKQAADQFAQPTRAAWVQMDVCNQHCANHRGAHVTRLEIRDGVFIVVHGKDGVESAAAAREGFPIGARAS
jgi:hypothetical protein